MTGLTFSGMRIRDTTADGINFHGGRDQFDSHQLRHSQYR